MQIIILSLIVWILIIKNHCKTVIKISTLCLGQITVILGPMQQMHKKQNYLYLEGIKHLITGMIYYLH